ncbi:MAG TPA: hypothetical protein VGL99_34415 [Chloroflexota bacterium]|jgi:hypothetical protein
MGVSQHACDEASLALYELTCHGRFTSVIAGTMPVQEFCAPSNAQGIVEGAVPYR